MNNFTISNIEVKNSGDIGGYFDFVVSGPEEEVINYIENINDESFYFSAHVTPNAKDINIIKHLNDLEIKMRRSHRVNIIEKLKNSIDYINKIDDEKINGDELNEYLVNTISELKYSQSFDVENMTQEEIVIEIHPSFDINKANAFIFSISNIFNYVSNKYSKESLCVKLVMIH